MGEDSHSDGVEADKFCALRTKKCKDGQEYQKNCDPPPKGWSKEFFWEGTLWELDAGGEQNTTVKRYFEAHHLLSIAPVSRHIFSEGKIKQYVRQTEWCINRKKNMVALPKWGHTIKYYCTIERDFFNIDEFFIKRKKGPAFKDLPMHDNEHGKYIKELDEKLIKIANSIRNSKKNHKNRTKDLRDKLNTESDYFRSELLDVRGLRTDGTHTAWTDAVNGKTTGWYKPFSMAKTPKSKAFPAEGFNRGIGKKIWERAYSYYHSA